MRTLTKVLATAVVCGACANASNPEVDAAAAVNAIRTSSSELTRAEAAKDLEKAITYWAADAVLQMPNMPQTQGTEAIRKGYEGFFANFPDKFESVTTIITVAKSADLAWEHGANHFTTKGVTSNGKYLAVWKNVDGAWKIAALAVSDDAPPPAPGKK